MAEDRQARDWLAEAAEQSDGTSGRYQYERGVLAALIGTGHALLAGEYPEDPILVDIAEGRAVVLTTEEYKRLYALDHAQSAKNTIPCVECGSTIGDTMPHGPIKDGSVAVQYYATIPEPIMEPPADKSVIDEARRKWVPRPVPEGPIRYISDVPDVPPPPHAKIGERWHRPDGVFVLTMDGWKPYPIMEDLPDNSRWKMEEIGRHE